MEKCYAPEYSDKEILDMLAKIFGVGVGNYSEPVSEEA